MAAITTETISDASDYARLAELLAGKSSSNRLWYRGCAQVSHKLIPSLYRKPATPADILVGEERTMLETFQDRSLPYRAGPLGEAWETLFVMQHYGVPTRLLDWSENAFLGLYFAVSQAEAQGFSADAAVWLLDPDAWNAAALPSSALDRGVLSRGAAALDGYRPALPATLMVDRPPLAIFGMHNSPRIVAQRGAFTVFSLDNRPMEEIFETGSFPDAALVRVLLPRASLASLRESLDALGFTESMVFPDLEGLARELKRRFGF